jgi:hypothetical protein
MRLRIDTIAGALCVSVDLFLQKRRDEFDNMASVPFCVGRGVALGTAVV